MIKRLIVLCIMIMTALTAAPAVFGSQYEENIKKSFPLDTSGEFLLDTLRGNIKLFTHSKNQVDIYITIASDEGGEVGKVEILFDTSNGGITVNAGKQLLNANVTLEYSIEVPENLKKTQAITRLGEIRARGKYGQLSLKTTTGEIDFKGNASQGVMQSANGDIGIDIRGSLKGDWTAKNVNGAIQLELRSSSDFTISGYSAAGAIRSDFKSVTQSGPAGSRIEGKVNNGAHRLRLESINGDIKILRR